MAHINLVSDARSASSVPRTGAKAQKAVNADTPAFENMLQEETLAGAAQARRAAAPQSSAPPRRSALSQAKTGDAGAEDGASPSDSAQTGQTQPAAAGLSFLRARPPSLPRWIFQKSMQPPLPPRAAAPRRATPAPRTAPLLRIRRKPARPNPRRPVFRFSRRPPSLPRWIFQKSMQPPLPPRAAAPRRATPAPRTAPLLRIRRKPVRPNRRRPVLRFSRRPPSLPRWISKSRCSRLFRQERRLHGAPRRRRGRRLSFGFGANRSDPTRGGRSFVSRARPRPCRAGSSKRRRSRLFHQERRFHGAPRRRRGRRLSFGFGANRSDPTRGGRSFVSRGAPRPCRAGSSKRRRSRLFRQERRLHGARRQCVEGRLSSGKRSGQGKDRPSVRRET